MKKVRVVDLLVQQGFFHDVESAKRAIMAGLVSSEHARIEFAGATIPRDTSLHVKKTNSFVSRGGLKLAGALEHFRLNCTQFECLDIGCSTGGFTDCLLTQGASCVVSLDVGYAQFSWKLRNDSRIVLLERTNICDLDQEKYLEYFDLAVCDVSFTSVTTFMSVPYAVLKPEGYFLTLIKPQFEAPKEDVGTGGIVTSAHVQKHAIQRVLQCALDSGFSLVGLCKSPIKGTKGNVEFFALLQKTSSASTSQETIEDLMEALFDAF